jgi:hypothetical protein
MEDNRIILLFSPYHSMIEGFFFHVALGRRRFSVRRHFVCSLKDADIFRLPVEFISLEIFCYTALACTERMSHRWVFVEWSLWFRYIPMWFRSKLSDHENDVRLVMVNDQLRLFQFSVVDRQSLRFAMFNYRDGKIVYFLISINFACKRRNKRQNVSVLSG